MNSKNNNKNFGILFFFIFILIAFWPVLQNNSIRLWSLIISFIFLFVAFVKPILLRPFYTLWIKFGEFLGKIIAPIVMFLIFFFLITPLSLLVRICGKDLLNLKFDKSKSYWIKKNNQSFSMKKQF